MSQREANCDPISIAAAVLLLAKFYQTNGRLIYLAHVTLISGSENNGGNRYLEAEEQFKKMVSLTEKAKLSSAANTPRGPHGPVVLSAREQIHVATALLHLADFYFFFGR